jgi:hypothetical protein
MTLVEQFKSARRVSTPLLGLTTSDQMHLIRALTEGLSGKALLSQLKRDAALVDLR